MRKSFIERDHPQLSVRRQSRLLSVNRNRLSPEVPEVSAEEFELMLAIDKLHLERPYFGSRRMAKALQALEYEIGRGRTRRLMRKMGIVAIYPKPRTSIKSPENKVYPYLLRDLEVTKPNQVWCSDITYIPMRRGFAHLALDHGLQQPGDPGLERQQHSRHELALCASGLGSPSG